MSVEEVEPIVIECNAEASNQCGAFAADMLKGSAAARVHGALTRDFALLSAGYAQYRPALVCARDDLTLLARLMRELETSASGHVVAWSKHLKVENPSTPTFDAIVAALSRFFDFDVFATRLNFYADNSAWKPFHHDSHAFASHNEARVKEDFTAGISLGAERALAFKHVESGQQFAFPQHNGDCFAFDSTVNSVFQHGVPRAKERVVGPRFSIIAWGRRRTLNERNAGAPEHGTRDPPDTARLDGRQIGEASSTSSANNVVKLEHAAPTNEEEVDENKEDELPVAQVAERVSEWIQKRREQKAADAAKVEKRQERARKKPRARVQGGWAAKR